MNPSKARSKISLPNKRKTKKTKKNLSEALQEAIKKIELRINQITVEITHLTNDLPNELISEYESLRSRPGHVGIAKLVNRTCNGCNLELPAVEVDRIKNFLKTASSTAKNAVASWFGKYAAVVCWPVFHYCCNSLCEPSYRLQVNHHWIVSTSDRNGS